VHYLVFSIASLSLLDLRSASHFVPLQPSQFRKPRDVSRDSAESCCYEPDPSPRAERPRELLTRMTEKLKVPGVVSLDVLLKQRDFMSLERLSLPISCRRSRREPLCTSKLLRCGGSPRRTTMDCIRGAQNTPAPQHTPRRGNNISRRYTISRSCHEHPRRHNIFPRQNTLRRSRRSATREHRGNNRETFWGCRDHRLRPYTHAQPGLKRR
jgi:hypothetical protein